MAVPQPGRKVTGAGFTLTGVSVWVVAAVGLTADRLEVALLGVIFGGVLAMAGLALSFAPARRVGASYFDEVEKVFSLLFLRNFN